jgi:predicted MFS family arabinose efflux permease
LPVVRSLFVVNVLGFLSYSVLLSALPAHAAERGYGLTAAGAVTTAFLATTVAGQGAVPALVRRWGLGPVLAGGLLALSVPAPLYLVAGDLGWLLAVSALRGVGFAVLTVLGATIAAQAVPLERRGESIGIYGLAISLPTVAAVPGGAALTLAGHFTWVAVLAAGTVVALAFVPGLVRAVGPTSGDSPQGGSWTAARASAAPSLVLLVVTLAGGGLVTFLPIERPDGSQASVALLLFGVSTALCRWQAGVLVDRLGARMLLPAGLGSGVLGLLLVALGLKAAGTAGAAAVFVGVFALGIAYGGVQNLTLVVALARAGEGRTTTVSAVWNACYDSGTAIGALVVGLVAARVGLPLSYVFVAVTLAAVFPLAVTLPRSLSRPTASRAGDAQPRSAG